MKKYIIGIFSIAILLAGCQEKEEPQLKEAEAPQVVSVDPADGETDLEGTALTVTFTFDQNVKCPPTAAAGITVDNNAVIGKVNAYNAEVTIELSSLEKGTTYRMVIPEGTISGFRENQKPVGEITYSFTMKAAPAPQDFNPVKSLTNPNATREAKNVYAFLLEQSGKQTLTGVQSSHSHKNDFVDAVAQHTGKHPALAGYDFLFLQFSPTPDNWSWVQNYNDISAPKEQWAANGLVNYMWHWNVPNSKADWDNGVNNYNFDGYAFYTDKTSFDINEALKEGTWQNDFIMKDIEEVAGYLKLLQDENIPVIWRPLHEAAGNYDLYGPNGAWFWWGKGGAEPCKTLWRLLYDQLVNVHGLNNLIWVWTVDVTPGAEDQYLEWYPGDEYVDIVGFDVYENNTDAKNRQYEALVNMTKGRKLVTISECGNIPDPEKCMEAGNRWSWFMVWSSADANGNIVMTPDGWNLNTLDYWKKVMDSPYTLCREEMPSLK